MTFMLSFNLSQVVQEPARITSGNRATLIDLALESNPNYLEECSVIPPMANSDHNGISLTIKYKWKKFPKWKYSQADFVKASDLIDETDWDHPLSGKSVDDACLIRQETFLSIMEQCIPRRVLPRKRMFLGHLVMLDISSLRETVHTSNSNIEVMQRLQSKKQGCEGVKKSKRTIHQ